MTHDEVTLLQEILKGKEKRVEIQRKLIGKYNTTLISFTLNIPGFYKIKDEYKIAHNAGVSALKEEIKKRNLKIIHLEENVTPAGFETFICVDAPMEIVKKMTISIEENHKLGRLFDLDVFDNKYRQVSRTEFNVSKRKCLICDENANVCRREGNHSLQEILNKIDSLIREYKEF